MKYLIILSTILLFACEEPNKIVDEVEAKIITECDCKELQNDHYYNVFHLGDPKNPYSGSCKEYFKGGAIKREAVILKGRYNGLMTEYFKDGQIHISTEYLDGSRSGHQKIYDESGTLLHHNIYERNKVKEAIFPKS